MKNVNVVEQISKIGIVPVIKIDDVKKAIPLAKALVKGGIPVAEITFRTDEAKEAIKIISNECPEILIGAGTITSIKTADLAIAAGAKFIVSPGFNKKVVKHCINKNIPIIPGCSTPTDIEKAMELGLSTLKFFPAEQSGGLPFIKAVSAPYSQINFMPTGGINLDNIGDYLAFDKVIACGGSWMVPSELISLEKFDEIAKLCKEAVKKILDFKLAHVGINTENKEKATSAAELIETFFDFEIIKAEKGFFNETYVEILSEPYYGKNGHIAISTPQINRAVYHLESRGVKFNYESAMYNDDKSLRAIYFAEEIAGFAFHIVKI